MDEKQVHQYLLTVISQGVSSSYANGCYSALRFLYETTLNKDWNMKNIPRSKKQSKLPVVLSPNEVLAIFDARIKAGIQKKASVHFLRYSFASHLLEAGTDLFRIQQLLGHFNLETTSRYLHIVQPKVLQVKSPLDLMEDNKDAR